MKKERTFGVISSLGNLFLGMYLENELKIEIYQNELKIEYLILEFILIFVVLCLYIMSVEIKWANCLNLLIFLVLIFLYLKINCSTQSLCFELGEFQVIKSEWKISELSKIYGVLCSEVGILEEEITSLRKKEILLLSKNPEELITHLEREKRNREDSWGNPFDWMLEENPWGPVCYVVLVFSMSLGLSFFRVPLTETIPMY